MVEDERLAVLETQLKSIDGLLVGNKEFHERLESKLDKMFSRLELKLSKQDTEIHRIKLVMALLVVSSGILATKALYLIGFLG